MNEELKKYIKTKLKMLKRDFRMQLTEEEKDYMYTLENEIQVDQYARRLIMTKL